MRETSVVNLSIRPMNISDEKCWMIFYTGDNSEQSKSLYVREFKGFASHWSDAKKRLEESDKYNDFYKVSVTPLDSLSIQEHLSKLKQLNLPLSVEYFPTGYDGTSYYLEIFSPSAKIISINWWQDGPAEWKSIIDWYHKMINYLRLKS